MYRLQGLLSVLFVFGLAVRAGTRFILPHSSRDFPPCVHISDDRLSNFLPDTLKYTSWSEANGDSEFANVYHRTRDDMNNVVTSTHAIFAHRLIHCPYSMLHSGKLMNESVS